MCQRACYLKLLEIFVNVESIRLEEQAVQGMIWFGDDDSCKVGVSVGAELHSWYWK